MDGNIVGRDSRDSDAPRLELNLDEGPLDVSQLDKLPTIKEILLFAALRPQLFPVFRAVKPVLHLGGFYFLTRYDDVRAALEHDQLFHVEGRRIIKANGGDNFVLGMQDSKRCPYRTLQAPQPLAAGEKPDYRTYQSWVMQHFRMEDLETLRTLMREAAERAIGRGCYVDAVSGLITHVAIAVCRDYYGVDVPDETESDFANTTFAISRWLFDPEKESRFETLGDKAAGRLRRILDRSIARADQDTRDTVIRRLLRAGVPGHYIRTIVFGMITGFVPTSTMGAGHMLEVLLSHKDAYKAAKAAADSGDDERLERCLFEAMRFKPLLREPLRISQVPYTFSEGSRRACSVKADSRIIALTAAAMMDDERVPNPKQFDANRPITHSLLYGAGLHRCIGAPIASLHAVETLGALLRAGELRKIKCNGSMKEKCGPFPKHMLVGIER